MRRSCSAFTARRTVLLVVISVHAFSSMLYFSRIWLSEKIRSRLRLQSTMNAVPTSLARGTWMPRRVTTAGSGLAACAGLLGGGGSSSSTLKPGTPVYGLVMVFIIDRRYFSATVFQMYHERRV